MNSIIVFGLVFMQLDLIAICFGNESHELIRQNYDPEKVLESADISIIKIFPEEKQSDVAERFKSIHRLERHRVFQDFQCGVIVAKNVIEFFNKHSMAESVGIMDMDRPPEKYRIRLPRPYRRLVRYQSHYDKRTNLKKVQELLSKWYYFISKKKCKYAENMRNFLDLYLKDNKGKFNNSNSLKITFAASIVRSNRFFNYIYRTLLPKLSFVKLDVNNDNAFFNFLFGSMRDYYFTIDDLNFINILLSNQMMDEIDPRKQLHYLDIMNPVSGENVVIPFSDYCPKQKITVPTKHYNLKYPSTSMKPIET